MSKLILMFAVLAAVFVYEASCQQKPRPPPPPPPKWPTTYRFRRDADEPQWLYKGDDVQRASATGDHPFLPKYIDDIRLDPNTRVAHSLGTPRATRGGGSRPSSSHDTGPTHPGYNRRNARSLPKWPERWPSLPPFNPRPSGPRNPWDTNPGRLPIYV